MKVTRIQYPIGQGCFHAGHIHWTDKGSSKADDFHYIYDCGSSDGSGALQDAIAASRRQTSWIDALFISHLDADHVNGIDRLLGSVSVGTVYIPYVDSVVPTLEILKADAAGAVSASLIEVHMDPRSWFGRRGVARIVRVRASLAAGPDEPVEEPVPESETGTNVRGRRDTQPQVETMNSGAMVITNPGHSLPWALVPHVDPAPKERLRAFHREVRSVLGLAPRQRLTAKRLAGAIRDNGERKRLRKCYEQIVSHGSGHEHNHVSMSLYSGPRNFDENSLWRGHVTMVCSDLWPAWWPHTVPLDYLRWRRPAVGWIGAGDAKLGVQKVRAAWQRSFQPFRKQISTLLLPHHGSGSRRSFHSDILDWPNLNLCVATAGDPSPYGHPDQAVVQKVLHRPCILHQVSQRIQSELREEFKLQC